MKKSIKIIVFLVLAVAILLGGIWYSNKLSAESNAADVAAGVAADQAQQQLMQNLKITDLTVGTGTIAANGDIVTVNYIGTLDNGTTFDSSYARNEPFSFTLGVGQVIKGWDLGVVGMRVGGKRTLIVPPELAYGSSSPVSSIPPNSTLNFTIQLLAVTSTVANPAGNANPAGY